MAEAVIVEPSLIEVATGGVMATRDERELRSWRFTAADRGEQPAHDPPPGLDGGRAVSVPHSWSRSEPELADHKGPCWYARSVVVNGGRRHRLCFEGLDYVGTVFADGRLLGHHEGGFTPVAFDLPNGPGAAVEVAVRVDDPVEEALLGPNPLTDPKRKVKGVFEFHDSRPGGHSHGVWFSPRWARRWGTGGIVGDVRLVTTGDVRLEATFVTAASNRIRISWVLVNLGDGPLAVELRAALDPHEREGAGLRVTATIPAGASRVSVSGNLDGAESWVPTSGPGHVATLHELATEIRADGALSDAGRVTFGVRSVEMPLVPEDQFRLHVDGRRIYVRGVNYIPGVWVPELTERTFRTDLALAERAGVNSVGLHAHVLPERFYDVADEAGMLVYQDFPLNLANDPDGAPLFEGGPTMGEASLLLAAETTCLLYNHPSVVYWCGHNEPAYQLAEMFSGATHPLVVELAASLAAAPNEEALDDARVEQWERIDPTRPAYKASGLGRQRPVGDSHSYSGSLNADATTTVTGTSATFLSEFGAWTPNLSAEASAPGARGDWPPDTAAVADWEERTHMWLGAAMKSGRPERYNDYATWAFASQLWAGMFLKLGIESFRRRKWDPFAGHRYHLFVDHWGDGGAGVVDRHRFPQFHYWALVAAHRLVLPAVAVPSGMRVEPGVEVVLPTWICNDSDVALDSATLSWSVRRLSSSEAFVIGVDDPQVPHRFGDPVVPWGDLVIVPSAPGTEAAHGQAVVAVGADGVVAGPEVRFTPGSVDDAVPYAIVLRLEVPGRDVVENWGALVAAPSGWQPTPGISPMPSFGMTLTGSDSSYRIIRRWTGATARTGHLDGRATVAGLAPGQYLVLGESGAVEVDLYGDVEVDLDASSATSAQVLPWPFDAKTSQALR